MPEQKNNTNIKRLNESADESTQKRRKTVHNEETFAYGTSIKDIPAERLLILDDYAFDLTELNSVPEKDLLHKQHLVKRLNNAYCLVVF